MFVTYIVPLCVALWQTQASVWCHTGITMVRMAVTLTPSQRQRNIENKQTETVLCETVKCFNSLIKCDKKKQKQHGKSSPSPNASVKSSLVLLESFHSTFINAILRIIKAT